MFFGQQFYVFIVSEWLKHMANLVSVEQKTEGQVSLYRCMYA